MTEGVGARHGTVSVRGVYKSSESTQSETFQFDPRPSPSTSQFPI